MPVLSLGVLQQVARTLPEALERAVAADDTTREDAAQIQALHDQAASIEAAAGAEYAKRETDRRITAEGRADAHAEDAKKTQAAFGPILATIEREGRAHAERSARAPHMTRHADGSWTDTPSERASLSDAALLLRHMKDEQALSFLLSLDVPARGAALRRLADSGEDPDDLLGAAERAAGYRQVMDPQTRAYALAARLRRNGLADSLRRSEYKAGALQRLRERIERLLADLGLPAARPPYERL